MGSMKIGIYFMEYHILCPLSIFKADIHVSNNESSNLHHFINMKILVTVK
jgi:hypothetical protein